MDGERYDVRRICWNGPKSNEPGLSGHRVDVKEVGKLSRFLGSHQVSVQEIRRADGHAAGLWSPAGV
jgi:hypothetical protein